MNYKLEGYYKVSVVDGKTNETIWEQPELKKNLILNCGLDAVASQYYANLLLYGIAGTGTRNNYIDPAGSVMSQTGTTITLNPTGSGDGLNHLTESFSGFSSAVSIGDVIKYSIGSGSITETTITDISDLTASVGTALTITSQSFTIWKTSQTGLQSEVKRAGTGVAGSSYLTGIANCGSASLSQGSYTLWRTFDFAIESVLKTYAEVGTAWTSTTGAGNIFSRIVLSPTVNVDVGQRLRLFYQLNLVASPATASLRPNVIVTNWPVSPSTNTNGSESLQRPLFSAINPSDGTTMLTSLDSDGILALEPNSSGGNSAFWISNSSAALTSWNASVDRTGATPAAVTANTTKGAYTAGTYTLTKTATFSAASFTATNIRSMGISNTVGIGSHIAGAKDVALAFVFDQNQAKANTQTLTLSWAWSWGRNLTN